MYRFAAPFLIALPLHAGPLPPPLSDADFRAVDEDQARIGQLLFHDKILSGNRNISCATCHALDHATGDGLSLGIGEGGTGVGPERTPGEGSDRIAKRIPRNAPALWNLGARDIRLLFHDGRLKTSPIYGNGFDTPAEEWLPQGLATPLAAQALFPMTAQFEMAGNPSENEIAGAVHDRIDAAWPILAKRVRTIPDYGEMFVQAFDHIDRPEQVSIVEIGNALGAYIDLEFRRFDTPFDLYLAGEPNALGPQQRRGMELFYGEAGCDACHAGPLMSDQDFHALALPQIGPGRTRRFDPYPRDVGRMGKSDRLEDAYRFRTPMLRNVALTAPYGHNGAYPTLRGILRHHADPLGALDAWTRDMARLPHAPWLAAGDFAASADRLEAARHRARVDLAPLPLGALDLADLEAFLHALTSPTAETFRFGKPETVPSGLPVD
ncbi:cytochrome-c peroxidase [Palleronia pelagia]|uniref:Cytochrome c peroxidase n=1 Tax=Palleronia pelagia TaxID=387096 RepID=A0A1H8IGM6_9RHOB|nr:cytochrome c peroxidase [Palleronia pelagia]SEN67511.1 cytochrome c peroxidase [Palleronia pelagia]